MLSNNRQLKEVKVAEIKEKLAKAQSVVLSQYQGLKCRRRYRAKKKP